MNARTHSPVSWVALIAGLVLPYILPRVIGVIRKAGSLSLLISSDDTAFLCPLEWAVVETLECDEVLHQAAIVSMPAGMGCGGDCWGSRPTCSQSCFYARWNGLWWRLSFGLDGASYESIYARWNGLWWRLDHDHGRAHPR